MHHKKCGRHDKQQEGCFNISDTFICKLSGVHLFPIYVFGDIAWFNSISNHLHSMVNWFLSRYSRFTPALTLLHQAYPTLHELTFAFKTIPSSTCNPVSFSCC